MIKPAKICVCGGGHLGHAIAGFLAAKGWEISVLTRQPAAWSGEIKVELPGGKELIGQPRLITMDPALALKDAGLIMITLPKFAIENLITRLKPHLAKGQSLLAIPSGAGFNWITRDLLTQGINILGLQRVPFISRIKEYGKSVEISGTKKEILLAGLTTTNLIDQAQDLERLFETRVKSLPNFLSATLNNSNPLLHPARYTTLFADWKPGISYPEHFKFYEDWNDHASQRLLEADQELQKIIQAIPLELSGISTIKEHYEISDTKSLTEKIRSIKAFKGIMSPMIRYEDGFVPDFTSRYFVEDIPFGTLPISAIAKLAGVKTPVIDEMIRWTQDKIGLKLLGNDGQIVVSSEQLPLPERFGIKSLDDLVRAELPL